MDQHLLSRRQTAALAGLALAGIGPARAEAQTPDNAATARGRVHDEAGKPIAEVLVSNGRDVVASDQDGAWSLSVRPGESLFVIKPTGWTVPVDPVTQLPRYTYLHVPDGTPAAAGLRFAGVAPTGPLPASIDFTLRRQDEPTRFNALLFTDPQPESLAELGFVRDDVVAQLAGLPAEINPAFGITTGDLMFDDLSWYERYNRILATAGLPWWNVCGNHDMNFEAPDNNLSRETFKRVFGARYAAFQYGGVTFLLLDNVEYSGFDAQRPNGGGRYRGFFGETQLGFVQRLLAHVPRDSLVVSCFHIPLRTLAGTEPANATVDAAAFLQAISSHPNSASFCGHTHTNEHYYLTQADGFGGGTHHHHIMAAVSGSWWSGPFDERGIPVAVQTDGTPNGFHILSVEGNQCRTALVPARDPERAPLRIMLDGTMHRDLEVDRDVPMGRLLRGPIRLASVGSTRVVVNLFDGGPRSKVEMQVGPGAALAMAPVVRADPFVQELYARNAATKKPWVQAGLSSHIWQANLPADLPAGTHRIDVRATDEHGRAHQAIMVLEVV
jgi:hypothetical protein